MTTKRTKQDPKTPQWRQGARDADITGWSRWHLLPEVWSELGDDEKRDLIEKLNAEVDSLLKANRHLGDQLTEKIETIKELKQAALQLVQMTLQAFNTGKSHVTVDHRTAALSACVSMNSVIEGGSSSILKALGVTK